MGNRINKTKEKALRVANPISSRPFDTKKAAE
jgi:hypothetical protein